MIKLALAVTAVLAAATTVPVLAQGDAAKKAEAQKKVDEAKVKGCEAVKTYLGKQKACTDQAAAAAKITCSASTFADMNALNADCSKALQGKAAAAATPKAPAAKNTTCKITDDSGAAVSENASSTFTGCMKDAKAAGKAKCAPGVKKVKLTYQFADKKPLASTTLCPK